MEYKITTSKIPIQCYDTAESKYTGLLIHIRPPIQLNSDAIERYLLHTDLMPVDHHNVPDEIRDVVVLGSTTEQTTIFASVEREHDGVAVDTQPTIQNALKHTAEFLQFMGTKATIEQSPIEQNPL